MGRRWCGAVFCAAAAAALAACGGDDTARPSDTTEAAVTTTEVAPTTTPTTAVPTTAGVETTTTVPSTTTASTSTAPTSTAPTTTVPAGLEQPAVWPAADVVYATPEDATREFVEQVLAVPAVLGEFMAGDSRSGEIEVLSPGEGGTGEGFPRSLLLLRQLGPDDGWFVLAALSDVATIDTPQGEVAAGEVEVSGTAMGFEATIIIDAYIAGTTTVLDHEVTMAGEMGVAGPYSVTLDLSAAEPGDIVTIVVRGSTGLETDPGDFGAIPVVVTG